MTRIFFLLTITIFFISCSPKKANLFSDPVLIQIADLQDRRSTDSLIQFLQSENPLYRKASAMALASVQDSVAAPALANALLDDKDNAVRISAAFALGQTGTFAAVNALIPALEDSSSHLAREVLEALGKTITKKDVSSLINYKPKDSLTTEGLAWAMYWLGLRNLSDTLVENRAIGFLDKKYSSGTRLAAAHFFARTKIAGKKFDQTIINAALTDPSAEVRMAAASALRKVSGKNALPAINQILTSEKDERVRTGAVRALQGFSFEEYSDLLFLALRDSSSGVQITASEVLRNSPEPKDKKEVERTWLKSVKNWRARANLLENLYSYRLPSEKEQADLQQAYQSSSNNYEKAALLNVFSRIPSAHAFVSDELMNTDVPVIRSSAAQCLVAMNKDKNFPGESKGLFAERYKSAIMKGDPAVVAIIAGALSDSTLGYKEIFKDSRFLLDAKKKLSLPKDFEIVQALDEAIAYIEGRPAPALPKNKYNHPINWALVKSIDKNQKVLIITTRGEIVIQLFVEEAPGSVANFVDLINRKYFDGKFVHRVVPNFVIQTGCNRGDGYGSEDYSIRSEFSTRKYKTGSVGMASSGKDTEGTQWFITHSPTPHLDGRYSIFAEVLSGMDVVNRIEVGDRILTVSLIQD